MSILQRLRPAIATYSGYSSAHMESAAETATSVRLNANELPLPPPVGCGHALNRYPHPQPPDLRQRLAELWDCRTEQILMTRGSDEAIDVLVRAFCESGQDAIAITPPVFGMYAVAAALQGAAVREFPLRETNDFQPDWQALACLPPKVKLVFLCSPNNPLGTELPKDSIIDLCHHLENQALVVVDEAYVEFSNQPSLARCLDTTPNLAVLRTVSKAWGLAGARLGGLLASPALIRVLRRVLPPYPIPEPVRQTVMQATGSAGRRHMRQTRDAVLREKRQLTEALTGHRQVVRVFPSRANFLLVRFHQAAAVLAACARAGLQLRDQSAQPGLDGCVRITVGTTAENQRILDILNAMPAPRNGVFRK